jgi:phage gp29-like protein
LLKANASNLHTCMATYTKERRSEAAKRGWANFKRKFGMGFGGPDTPQPNPFKHPNNAEVDPLATPALLPPANGQVVAPSVQQLVALLQAGRRFYFQSDQAVRDSQDNAQVMRRNLSIMTPLQDRMLSACQMPISVIPPDHRNPEQMRIAQELQGIIEEIPYLFKYKWALMEAIWYGRAAVQNIFEFDFSKGYKRLVIKDWIPISGDNLVYKWDSPAVAIRVGVTHQGEGTVDIDTEPADFSRVHTLTMLERESFTIHTHLFLAGDFLDPYSAGNVKGTGIRNVVYWTWFLQNQCLGMLTEFLERMGLGFTVVTFEAGNPQAYNQAQTIAQAQSFSNVITWPRYPGQDRGGQDDIYRIEPSLAGVENFMRLIDQYWGSEIRRYVVGQDATSRATPGGLGSDGAADVQENTFMRLIKMDCLNLEDTLTRELLWVLQKYTFPNLDFKCRVKINAEKPDKKEYMEAVKTFIEIGGTVIESEARQTLGFTEPTPEDKILGGKQTDDKVLGLRVPSNMELDEVDEETVEGSEEVVSKEVAPEMGEDTIDK